MEQMASSQWLLTRNAASEQRIYDATSYWKGNLLCWIAPR